MLLIGGGGGGGIDDPFGSAQDRFSIDYFRFYIYYFGVTGWVIWRWRWWGIVLNENVLWEMKKGWERGEMTIDE